MSAGANVTQWLAWALMILTGSMNRPGGVWFHPGFALQFETFELPVSPREGGLFGPGPPTRPGSRSFLGEWPCAVLADEIRAGNIRAVLNLGGHLVTAFPESGSLVPALRSLDVLATIEIIANDTTALSTHVLPTKDQLERADVTLWDFLLPRSSDGTSVTISPTPTVRTPPTRPGSRSSPPAPGPHSTSSSRPVGSSRAMSFRRNGRRRTSTGWAAGASRHGCSSTRWPR